MRGSRFNASETAGPYDLRMADVFDQYAMAEAWDEMFARPDEPRAAYRSLFAALQPLSVADLRARADQLGRVFTDRGVTFTPRTTRPG
jgi:uncharacterized circularly permuted ATP-grasp superfamily protein